MTIARKVGEMALVGVAMSIFAVVFLAVVMYSMVVGVDEPLIWEDWQ